MTLVRITCLILGLCALAAGQKAVVSGYVRDPYGALIVGATVRAVNQASSRSYEAKTNQDGEYRLELPFVAYQSAKPGFKIPTYEISATAPYFKVTTITGVKVPGYYGVTRLDIALDVPPADPCHDPTACPQAEPIEIKELEKPSTEVKPRPRRSPVQKTNH